MPTKALLADDNIAYIAEWERFLLWWGYFVVGNIIIIDFLKLLENYIFITLIKEQW